ncbi:PREDICTED: probable asparagine--tRNA ligase, mitochondrial [Dufourea novaeangliae]|uniref:asparagine--tRNA ligase n=1 Tax=Dufourea novaeangliae TaxID=178035 RepID=A0A154NZK7_DUFNO|nr:PREDICTED: probable asparagine--tRNA ligase, mitochondrial [Dufourea novaeangliae]KZC04428.1 putative asparagine--tRNA ligase, mitochondrial [Dufourea novaeangliae]
MFSKYIEKLLLLNLKVPKCNVHSMSQICDTNCKEALGKRMKVQGWVWAVRKMKNNIFVDISDGSTSKGLQVVIPKSNKLDTLSYGSSIMAEGELTLAPNGSIELHANDITVIGTCDVMDGYPFAPRKQYSEEYIRQYLHLRPRTRTFSSLLRLRDLTSASIGNYFRNREFINVHTPVLTSNDCEGAGELFSVKPCSAEILQTMKKEGVSEEEYYFNSKAFLTVSGQLHLEAVARALTRVYTFGPTFRAENSKSRLHLSEFYMVEAEVAFIDSIDDIMDEVELLIKSVTKDVVEKGAPDMHSFGCHEPQWLNKKFTRMTYDDAFKILENNVQTLEKPATYGTAFSKKEELFLVEQNNSIPIFVTNWPKEIKPFYMKACKDDDSKVAAMDLLVPEVGELVGGSMREDDYKKLKSKLPLRTNLSWYLELRKYGNVPTGGFGMGFERFLQSILGISNIKDTLPFPRWPHNCNL